MSGCCGGGHQQAGPPFGSGSGRGSPDEPAADRSALLVLSHRHVLISTCCAEPGRRGLDLA